MGTVKPRKDRTRRVVCRVKPPWDVRHLWKLLNANHQSKGAQLRTTYKFVIQRNGCSKKKNRTKLRKNTKRRKTHGVKSRIPPWPECSFTSIPSQASRLGTSHQTSTLPT